jgi:outer membrane lipoprotein-sorting protein
MHVLYCLALATLAPAAPSIDDIVQKNLRDASFVAVVKVGSVSRLRKINDDFVNSYRVKESRIRMKEPLMLRLDAKVDGSLDASFILNGTTQVFRVPSARINVKQDLSKSPGRRQTPLDFGILTPSIFRELFDAKYVRTDRESGQYVFDLTYQPRYEDATRHRVWVDPVRKYTVKREWYNRRGRLLAVFSYNEPQQIGGVWLPTRCIVRNADNEVAGETWYEAMKANTGLEDDLFKV